MIPKIKILILILPFVVWIGSYFAPGDFSRRNFKEAAEIEKTILNYVEGVYGTDTTGIYKSVHPNVTKREIENNAENGKLGPVEDLRFEQLINEAGSRKISCDPARENFVKRIVVFDVQDIAATAKLTTVWGTDYFHLVKEGDSWYIVNILWHSTALREPGISRRG